MKKLKNQKGQSLVEYLIIVALVAVSSIVMMRAVGQNINVQFAKIAKSLGGDVEGKPKAAAVSAQMYEKRDLRNFMHGSLRREESAGSDD